MKPHLTRVEAAKYLTDELGLPTTKGTLQKLATVGGGPPYDLYGNKSIYKPSNLNRWAEEKMTAPKRSTSESA
jgi:hypothetical protein